MKGIAHKFSSGTTNFLFSSTFSDLRKVVEKKDTIIITDENVFAAHAKKFVGWRVIVIPAGEEHKTQATCDVLIEQLVNHGADRGTSLVGVGGGMVTDITGYVASVYMRGVDFGFVPTTVLAMVDAAIGGKNGIDHGVFKNLVGVIRQPRFILYDVSLLRSLPKKEWSNGFAEVIKHACIKDGRMFGELEKENMSTFLNTKKMSSLIMRNAGIKISVVKQDEFEKGPRKLLNFGHTLGHALEKQYDLSHGEAIAIGMSYASKLSQSIAGFKEADRVIGLLERYGLPADMEFDHDETMSVMKADKKRAGESIDYILLNKIGKGVVKKMPVTKISQLIKKFNSTAQ